MWRKGEIVLKTKLVQQGRKILRDWLGEGGVTVPFDQAQARANICINCPHNYKGEWLWRVSVRGAVMAQMKLRAIMGIELFNEQNLHICKICGCMLKLKVHTPFKHLYAHTPDEMFSKYPDFCWQKIELNQIPKE